MLRVLHSLTDRSDGFLSIQSNFSLEVEPKTFLQNKLAKDENDLDEVLPRVQSLRKEVTKLDELRKAYIENPALGDLDSVVEVSVHQLWEHLPSRIARNANALCSVSGSNISIASKKQSRRKRSKKRSRPKLIYCTKH